MLAASSRLLSWIARWPRWGLARLGLILGLTKKINNGKQSILAVMARWPHKLCVLLSVSALRLYVIRWPLGDRLGSTAYCRPRPTVCVLCALRCAMSYCAPRRQGLSHTVLLRTLGLLQQYQMRAQLPGDISPVHVAHKLNQSFYYVTKFRNFTVSRTFISLTCELCYYSPIIRLCSLASVLSVALPVCIIE